MLVDVTTGCMGDEPETESSESRIGEKLEAAIGHGIGGDRVGVHHMEQRRPSDTTKLREEVGVSLLSYADPDSCVATTTHARPLL